MKNVTALKSYGQHFLTDTNVLNDIIQLILSQNNGMEIIEVGPGTGALTKLLFDKSAPLTCIELDKRCVEYLHQHFDSSKLQIIEQDVLQTDFNQLIENEAMLVGNFPYNISSQIVFKVLDYKEKIPVCIGMFQKEMAIRLAAAPGKKDYGITSVLTQLFYDVKVEFDIAPQSFSPPPKVMSSVLTMKRKENVQIDFNFKLFKTIVKAGFNQRRKMLRSALKGVVNPEILKEEYFNKRAEQLSISDYIALTKRIEKENA